MIEEISRLEMEKDQNEKQSLYRQSPSFQIPHLIGEMKAKLVSQRKIVLCWNVTDILKNVIQLYYNCTFDNLVHVIRIYDVSQTSSNRKKAYPFYEIFIPYDQEYWFVKGLISNRSYFAEIGVKVTESNFFPLLRSNSFHIPGIKMTINNEIYEDISKMDQYEDRQPIWRDHVSTYSYYVDHQ